MPRRKIGWGESQKPNVIGLVDALLLLADGELELDEFELKAAMQVEWVAEDKLRVTGKIKQKRGKREKTVEVGTTKKDLVHLVKKAGKSLEPVEKKSEAEEAEKVQNVIDCLRELGVLEEEPNTKKNQGYWKFSYDVLLECAQNMPYPDFYQAWHQTTIQ